MDENLKTLYEMCDIFSESLKDAKEKLRKSSGPVSVGDADYVDKLTHTIKSLETTIAMKEAKDEDEGGYSERYPMMPRYGYAYDDGRSYADGRMADGDGRSYAGRQNARRDSMGRYSSRGYSRDANEDFRAEVEALMQKAPDEHARAKLQSMLQSM